MTDFLDKLSSYNLFNYLLPGTLFSGIGTIYSSYNFVHENIFIAVFIFYFVGLVISRIGSLVIEPILKWVNFLEFTDYQSFVLASQKDNTLSQLSETNNMYRTLCSLIICTIFLVGLDALSKTFLWLHTLVPFLLVVSLLLLFLFSYRKQTKYVTARVRVVVSRTDD